jgi:hypothetical protein
VPAPNWDVFVPSADNEQNRWRQTTTLFRSARANISDSTNYWMRQLVAGQQHRRKVIAVTNYFASNGIQYIRLFGDQPKHLDRHDGTTRQQLCGRIFEVERRRIGSISAQTLPCDRRFSIRCLTISPRSAFVKPSGTCIDSAPSCVSFSFRPWRLERIRS